MDCLLGLVRTNGITLLTYPVSQVAKVDLHLIWTAKIYKNRHTSLIFLSTDSAAGRSRWDCSYPSQLYCWMPQCVYVDKLFPLWFNPPRDPKESKIGLRVSVSADLAMIVRQQFLTDTICCLFWTFPIHRL